MKESHWVLTALLSKSMEAGRLNGYQGWINLQGSRFMLLLLPLVLGCMGQSLAAVSSSCSDSLRVKSKDEPEQTVEYEAADSLLVDFSSNQTQLMGKVKIRFGTMELQSGRAYQNWRTRSLKALPTSDSMGRIADTPRFVDGAQSFVADSMEYDLVAGRGKITELVTREGEAYVIGRKVQRVSEGEMYVRNTLFTTCSDTRHPHFHLQLGKAKLIPDKRIITGPSRLVALDIPLPIGLPFAVIPLMRGQKAGILFPEYGNSPQFGFFLRNGGYYWPLSSYMDLSLRGDIYAYGGWRLNPSIGYNKRYRSSGRLNLNWSNLQSGDPKAIDFSRQRDFMINWQHNQDAKAHPYRRFSASVQAGSSNFLRNNTASTTDFLNNQLNSSVSYSRAFPGKPIQLNLAARHSQNTQTRRLQLNFPEGNLNIARVQPFRKRTAVGAEKWFEKIGFTYQSNLRSSLNIADSLFSPSNAIRGLDAGIQHNLPFSTSSFRIGNFVQITPGFAYQERWSNRRSVLTYDAALGKASADTERGFFRNYDYQFSLLMNTRLFGLLQYSKGPVAAIRHVINPQMTLGWRPDFGSARFGFYRTVQVDPQGNTRVYSPYSGFGYGVAGAGGSASLSWSIDNNLEFKTRASSDSGEVLVRRKLFDSFRFGGAYNFNADSLKMSAIQWGGRTQFGDRFSLLFSGIWDVYQRDSNRRLINRWVASGNWWRPVVLSQANFTVSGGWGGASTGNAASGAIAMPPVLRDRGDSSVWDDFQRYGYRMFIDWNIPYRLNFNYNLTYQTLNAPGQQWVQSLTFNGDLSLTRSWKIAYNSGIDLVTLKLTPTVINIYRDLHCWEMSLNLVPFGTYKSYTFTINAKGQMLQDLRLIRRRNWFDLQR
jgi:hypothetical protein